MERSAQFASLVPQGHTLFQRLDLASLQMVSNTVMAFAFLGIAFASLRFVRGREDLPRRHRRTTLMFVGLMALGSLTYVGTVIDLSFPNVAIEAMLMTVRSIIALVAAGWLIVQIPTIRKMPSMRAMQREIAAHAETMAALNEARAELAAKVNRTEGELRMVEQDRRFSAALLSAVVENVPGPVYAKDSTGRLLLANKATLAVIGQEWAAVAGKRNNEFMRDLHRAEMIMADDQQVLDSGTIQESELIFNHPKRGPIAFLDTKVPLRFADGQIRGLVGVAVDITEHKRLSRELLHASRRTAMGEMAAALAHELRQPLAAIGLYLDGSAAILESDGYDGPLTQSLSLAKDQCRRASEIIRRLRSFVQGGDDERQPEDVRQLIEEACTLALVGVRESGVTATIAHQKADVTVLVDRVQIEQVIVNLVRNAVDAIAGRANAELRIVTHSDTEDEITVSVIDNGPGLTEAIAGRLFEPFFSTKGVKGMGLGLSICRTIVEGHGGKIWADPNVEAGAAFHFTLPLSKAAAAT